MKAHQYLATSIATLLATIGGQRAMALPQGESVAHGKASFKRDGGRMEIRASDRAVINFRGFNIDRKEAVTFVQPGATARVLNRVTDGNPTRIFGQLKANGQVMLVNPSGVFFENGSVLNVGGIVAAAGKISDQDFLAGRRRFTELSGEVNNAGTIRATGDVNLFGAHVVNTGVVQSAKGMVSMVAGDEVLVGERGGNVYVSQGGPATPGKAAKAGVVNTGRIVAKKVLLGAGDFYAVALRHSGEILAEEAVLRGGKGGRVEVSGRIDASARGKGRKGGRIEVTGETVALTGAKLDASGDLGGGAVLLGGDWQGGGAVNRAQTTTVDAATVIQADAVRHGGGGKVVVWADGATQFDGQISARGVGAGQAGGQVETSGKLTLGVGQTARVDASSPQGKMGDWLLDPTNLTIATGGAGTIGGSGDQTVDASVINSAAASVTLSATNDITFNQAIAMTRAGAGLAASAGRNLVVNPGISISTNNGAINFTADSDADGGGFLTLGAGSQLITKGAAVNLTVDHGAAASDDGITILGNVDASAAGLFPTSTFQVLGTDAARNGVLSVGAAILKAGQGASTSTSYGKFVLRADEINLTGAKGSVTGSGALTFEQANTTTGLRLAAKDNLTAGQLDLTRQELFALENGTTGKSDFIGLTFGRSDSSAVFSIGESVPPIDSNALIVGGSAPATSLIQFRSGTAGIVGNIAVSVPTGSTFELTGNVINLKAGLSAKDAIVTLLPMRSTTATAIRANVEILDMTKPGQDTVVPGTLRLDTAMLKQIADGNSELRIGDELSPLDTTLTVLDSLALNAGAGAKGGLLRLSSGGPVIFNEGVNAGRKSLAISARDIQSAPGKLSAVTGAGGLTISPPIQKESTWGLEVYGGGRRPYDATKNVFTVLVDDLNTLAKNFAGVLQLGRENATVGGSTTINAPIDLTGSTVTGLSLHSSATVSVNAALTLTKKPLDLRGMEIDLLAPISGTDTLTIQPANNFTVSPTLNPVRRGMVLGVASQVPDRLTITEAEYEQIGNDFTSIVFGRYEMENDLRVAGFGKTSRFSLKANTVLFVRTNVILDVPTGGTLHSDKALKRLWVRSMGLDINQDVSDLSTLAVNFFGSIDSVPFRFLLNRSVGSSYAFDPKKTMDLNSSKLGRIKESVALLRIGDPESLNHAPIEVLESWTLPTHTELRSDNRLLDATGPKYGSIRFNPGVAISGNGKNLSLYSDSDLSLLGGPGSISNVGKLEIYTPSKDIPVRLLDSVTNPRALVVSPESWGAFGANIKSLIVGRGEATADFTVVGRTNLLAENTTFDSGTGNLMVLGALDGGSVVTLNSRGLTTLAESLGATTPLASLTISRGADVTGFPQKTILGRVGGPAVAVRTSGLQSYAESVELLNGGTLEAGGTLTVSQTLAAGANDLALLANEMLLAGSAGTNTGTITGTRGLQLGTGTSATNMTFFGTTVVAGQLDLTQSKLRAIALAGFNKLTLGRADGTGSLSVKENYSLLQETLIQTGGGALNIEKQLNGAQKLTLSSGAGNIAASAALGGTTALGDLSVFSTGTATFQGAVRAASVLTDVGGSTALNGGAVTTSGSQDYSDALVLGAATTLSSSGASDVNVNAGATGAFALNVNTSGVTRLRGAINLASLQTDAGGTVELPGTVTTSGAQTYNDAAVLGAATTLASTGGGAVAFNGGARGAFDLTVNTAGVTTLGGGINVASITTDGPGTVRLSSDIRTTGAQSYGEQAELIGNTLLTGTTVSFGNTLAGGASSLAVGGNAVFGGAATGLSSLSVSGTTAINGGTVTTSGAQTYTGAVTLGSNAALTGTTVRFVDTVAGGAISLGVTGNAEFNGAVSGLSALGVTGTTLLNTSAVATSGAQTYGGRVTLAQDAVLTSTGSGDVTLDAGATGNQALVINTSGVTQLGGGISVGSVTTDAGGTVRLAGDIRTTGAQSYGEQSELIGDTALTGTTVSFADTVAGGANSLGVTGNAEFNGAVSRLSTLGVTGATLLSTSAVTTSGAQTYGGRVTLAQDAVLTSTNSGDVTLNAGATGDLALVINTGGVTQLGGGISVGSVTTDAGGTVRLSGTITTTGAQTYDDAAVLGAATILTSTAGGVLALNGGADGAHDLTVNTAGVTTLGGGISVASLSTDAGGSTEITGDVTTTGTQTYGDAVQVSGPVALRSTGGGALTLNAGADGAGAVSLATSGNVTVTGESGVSGALEGFSARGNRVEVGGVSAAGDVTLDASDLLVLQGARYASGAMIALNPTERPTASGRSSIVKPSGDVAFESDKFVMGGGHKLVVSNGALSVTAASGVVGDLAASVSMDLNVDNLQVLARAAGEFTNAGLKDIGLSMVSPKIAFNGTLSYSPDSTGAKTVFWNTASGAVSGKNNVTRLAGSGVAKNARMSEQFNSVDGSGYVLQPLAVKPPMIPPIPVDPEVPVKPPVTPEDQAPLRPAFVRPVPFDLMNWSLGYRDETLEPSGHIWVIRTLGINGRWDNLGQILSGEPSARRKFLEL